MTHHKRVNSVIADCLRPGVIGEHEGGPEAVALDVIEHLKAAGYAIIPQEQDWQPIETLHRLDTDVVLWNPCDGVHLLNIMNGLEEMAEIRRGLMFTHWRKLAPPSSMSKEAREILAFPHMVDALRGVLDQYNEGDPDSLNEAVNAVRQALFKATGERA